MTSVHYKIVSCPFFNKCNSDNDYFGSPMTGFFLGGSPIPNRKAEWLIIGERPGLRPNVEQYPDKYIFTSVKFLMPSQTYYEKQRHEWLNVSPVAKLLINLLKVCGIPLEDTFFTNVIKCPTYNPNSTQDASYFKQQVKKLSPEKAIVVGKVAKKLAGQYLDKLGIRYVYIYHPSFYLRKGWKDYYVVDMADKVRPLVKEK